MQKNMKEKQNLKKGLVWLGALVCMASSGIAMDASAANNSGVNVTLDDTISLTVLASSTSTEPTSDLEFNIDPDGELHAKDAYARVSTNAAAGYRLSLETSSSTTDLVQNGASRQIVGTVTDGVTASTMRQNSWGYSLDATSFSKVPAKNNAATLKTGEKTTTDQDSSAYEDTVVTFGIKVDSAITSGTYTNTVVFTAVSNE